MNKYNFIFFIFILSATSAFFSGGCKEKDNVIVPIQPGKGSFVDYGVIPDDFVNFVPYQNNFQQIIYYNNQAFVATSAGIYKNDLATKDWSLAGLQDKMVTCLYAHPEVEGKFFAGVESNDATEKSVYISNDGGKNWQPATAPVFDNIENKFELYAFFATRPSHPDQIFANLNGPTIAISDDGGMTWSRANYATESFFGYSCPILFLSDNPNQIYQGAEAPLDDAWLATYDVDETDPVILKNFTKIIDATLWSNRRPNQLITFSNTPGVIYVGQEGALSKVTETKSKFIFKSETGSSFPYTYVTGIWIDPKNNKHILFGGTVNGTNETLSLFETYDEGTTTVQLKDKMGMSNPIVKNIVSTDTDPLILIVDEATQRQRLMMYKPAQ